MIARQMQGIVIRRMWDPVGSRRDEVEISSSKSKKPSKGWVFVETKAS
ncbi:hypothetical protein [Alteromonas macleodii]